MSLLENDLVELRSPRWRLVRERADALTNDYSAPPIPVLEVAESCGVDVVFDEFAEYADQVAGFCDFESKKLFVNSNDPTNRKIFTIAHELGHWVLHRAYFEQNPQKYPILPRFQSVDLSNPYEQEANSFAANLLVPKRLLDPVRNASISELASIFGVSKQMMEIRLKNG